MIVTGEHTFPGTREAVWELLQDPEVLVKAMPGARRLTATGDGTYEGVVRIGVGPVTAAEWKLSVELHDRERPASYVMHVDTKGPLGFTRGTATVALVEVDEGTRMLYHADLAIGGKVASVGQRLLDQVAKMLTRQGLNALNKEMEARLLSGAVVEEWTGTETELSGEAEAIVEVLVVESVIVDAAASVDGSDGTDDRAGGSVDQADGSGDAPDSDDAARGTGEGGR
jgi:uncharacterized protein